MPAPTINQFEIIRILRKRLPDTPSHVLLAIADDIGEAKRRGATIEDVEMALLHHGAVVMRGELRESCEMRQRETE